MVEVSDLPAASRRTIASSTFFLSGTTAPRRKPPSDVMTILAPQSWMRSATDWALNPPKTTLCTAPIRVQANIAMAASGIMGK